MKKNNNCCFNRILFLLGLSFLLSTFIANAGKPLCLLVPLSSPKITVPSNATAGISYLVTNQSKITHTFRLTEQPGIIQTSFAGACTPNFTLAYQESCVLNLVIAGSELQGDIHTGPEVCDQGNPLLCYRPSLENNLQITRSAPVLYSVGGAILGLTGTLTLENNGKDSLLLTADGGFTFSEQFNPGEAYNVTVKTQPADQLCTVSNGTGVIESSNINNVTVTCSDTFTVGGDVYGLAGTLTLSNNLGETITLESDSDFEFSHGYVSGSNYKISILSSPSNQTCTLTDGQGIIEDENVDDVSVICSPNSFFVGGDVVGLISGGRVTLVNNDTNETPVDANTSFTFSNPVAQGATYNVRVISSPATQTCYAQNNTGQITNSDVSDVEIVCNNNAYSLGGNASGLTGPVKLLNNGGDAKTVYPQDSTYVFSQKIPQGATYEVTIDDAPESQTCQLSNSTGTMGSSPVTNVNLTCTTNTSTLSSSLSEIALSVTGLTEYGVTGTPSSGLPRILTITNTGATAQNLTVTFPAWPSGTSATTTCTSSLPSPGTCTITITPGAIASTSNGTDPCNSAQNPGSPIPLYNSIVIKADNTNELTIPAYILGYGCIYEGGYIFAFDDTIANNNSVGGKVFTNQVSQTSIWSSNNIAIYGINAASTPTSPSPTDNMLPGQTACDGKTNGRCNSSNIQINYAGDSSANYAAKVCIDLTVASKNDWYLPAICELFFSNSASSPSNICRVSANVPVAQSISSAIDGKQITAAGVFRWSSTQQDENNAWASRFSNNSAAGIIGTTTLKTASSFNLFCARAF